MAHQITQIVAEVLKSNVTTVAKVHVTQIVAEVLFNLTPPTPIIPELVQYKIID